eukprot:NODE_424_length_8864_cov_0.190188.p6 type:complete len:138 gc:universal NODE_424_length_8864_cov_0.190188:1011-598(-)
MKKQSESVIKRIFQDRYGISSVKPSLYGNRFYNFMRTLTKNKDVPADVMEFPPLPILESKLKEGNEPKLSLVQAFQKVNHRNVASLPIPKKNTKSALSINAEKLQAPIDVVMMESPEKDNIISTKLQVLESEEVLHK